MTSPTSAVPSTDRRRGRSALALFVGFLFIVVSSLAVDQLFHSLGVYPPWGEPMYDPGLNLLALAYRSVFAVIGCYLAARLAPHSPMRHAMILGVIGVVLSTAGAIGMMGRNAGPSWYPIALVLTTLPLAWLGGAIQRRQVGRRSGGVG